MDTEEYKDENTASYGQALSDNPFSMILCIYCVIFSVFIVGLFGFHNYLLS